MEFELLYKNIRRHTTDLSAEDKTFLNAFCNYGGIKQPYKYKDVIAKLERNKDICFLKQDKGKGVVIMNRTK